MTGARAGGNANWPEVERAFAAAVDLPADRRAAFLAELPAAIRTEVETLLSADGRASNFLGGSMLPESSGGPAGHAVNIEANTQIGAYRIESLLGKGGMGVVYRALDTKLNRPVAMKFLFDDLGDAAARRRFQREAQLASSLSHPHILTVHDTGEYQGCQYMVLEFVDAGTLTDWARAEKRSWREIIALLTGVADALATAHEAGILHRDIKPDNILVGRNGYAKLADFGLAKLQERIEPDEVTRTARIETTMPGMVVGTIAYMSPEQVTDRPIDRRSDIFSFGVVLYELLAGRRPFSGQSRLDVMQGIVHADPSPLPDEAPANLRMAVEKALEKDPAERYQSMRDLVVDLRRLTRQRSEVSSGQTAPAPPVPSVAPPRGRGMVVAALLALALLLGAGALFYLRRPVVETPRQVVQFEIAMPPGTMFSPTVTRQSMAISPNGKRLAFTATTASGTNVWIRDLASPEMHPVAGTDGAWSMFWSPDSRSLLFSVRKTLKEVNLESGSARTVAELSDIPQLGSWRNNGDLVLYLFVGEMRELHLKDGSMRKGPGFGGVRWPQFLPGSDRLLYAVYDKGAPHGAAVVAEYDNPKPVRLMQTDSRVEYALPARSGEPGYLVFIRDGNLLAQPFDADRFRLAGDSFPIAQNVVYYGPTLAGCFSMSDNGVLVYQPDFPVSELKWYDRGGNEVGSAARPVRQWGNVRVSRDGRRVATAVWNPAQGATSIWSFDADGRESRQITFPPDVHRRPVWSPDGTHIAVGASAKVGGPRVTVLDVSGADPPKEFGFAGPGHPSLPTDWSSDGRFIAADDGVQQEQQNVWIAEVASGKTTALLKNNFAQWGTAFSPDGKQVAFVSLESGRPEVYLQAFEPDPTPHVAGERRQVSRDGAWLVRWRRDSHEIYFLGLDNQMRAAAVRGVVDFGEPTSLFHIAGVPQYSTTRDFQFDVSPDGQRFIFPSTGLAPPPPLTVIENWQEKFRQSANSKP